jgi:MATE family multidrug resistance protein
VSAAIPGSEADRHPFVAHPHRTLVALTVPVLFSMLAEPVAGLVDTFFVARLGAAPLAALGAATALLSSLFWVFNFLGIGTQSEVAHALGQRDAENARDAGSLALALALAIGAGLALVLWPALGPLAAFMADEAPVRRGMETYLAVRLLGAPAVLVTLAAFGALRGLQEMRTPLWVATAANLVNAALDPLLISGAGPLPALGVAGAAWASVAGQWLGAAWAAAALRRRIGLALRVPWARAPGLLVVGRDLFLRTGLLTLFLLLATRTATRLGADPGAAHQAVRQVWLLTAFVLDSYALSAQSLVGYFLGAGRVALARRVAGIACAWGLATGALLAGLMLAGEAAVSALLVPPSARPVFPAAWRLLALAQPLNALSFVTDGIHWGTRDYRYLRNAMFAATALGLGLLAALSLSGRASLGGVWLVTVLWIGARAAFGAARIWPAPGLAPLRPARQPARAH